MQPVVSESGVLFSNYPLLDLKHILLQKTVWVNQYKLSQLWGRGGAQLASSIIGPPLSVSAINTVTCMM